MVQSNDCKVAGSSCVPAGMDTTLGTNICSGISNASLDHAPMKSLHKSPGKLPPGFDTKAFTHEACQRSGVTFAVTDVIALSKLRTLLKPED